MRIDRLQLRNFKRFAEATFEFPRVVNGPADSGSFHVLIGENGTGKTSILDAAAVALGVWLEKVPDSSLARRPQRLRESQRRVVGRTEGDRTQFQPVPEPTSIRATGTILERSGISWGQELAVRRATVNHKESKEARDLIWSAYERISRGEKVLLPVICYYGAGRAWLPHNERKQLKARSNGRANRWEAFYDCLNERIRISDLAHWFQGEHIAMGNRQGRYRPGFEVVRRAVTACVPGADGIWYDSDSEEIALSIDGNAQPFGNLSAGQRVMLALVADLAIRMVTQNNFLVPPDVLGPEDEPLPRVLAQTPGVVLIDELDVHLHPKWQRRVSRDLKRVFPKIQFLTTTHSPQVIGGVEPQEIVRLLPDGGHDVPAQSFGMDTNWILEVLMDADKEEPGVKHGIEAIFGLISERRLDDAQAQVQALRQRIGNSEMLQRAASTIERIRTINR